MPKLGKGKVQLNISVSAEDKRKWLEEAKYQGLYIGELITVAMNKYLKWLEIKRSEIGGGFVDQSKAVRASRKRSRPRN